MLFGRKAAIVTESANHGSTRVGDVEDTVALRALAQRVDEQDDEIAALNSRFIALRARVTAELRRVQRALEQLDAAAADREDADTEYEDE